MSDSHPGEAAATESAGELWTIGHSTLEPEDFLAELAGARIDLVADVRSFPGSRKHPQFGRENMATWLGEAGVVYEHIGELGGRRRRSDLDPELNRGWRNESFRNYADHTLTDEYEHGLDRLVELAGDHRVAIMCAEAVPWRCHRSLVANTLVARGWQVHHLMPEADPLEHEVGRWGAEAVIDGDRVLYPESVEDSPTPLVRVIGPEGEASFSVVNEADDEWCVTRFGPGGEERSETFPSAVDATASISAEVSAIGERMGSQVPESGVAQDLEPLVIFDGGPGRELSIFRIANRYGVFEVHEDGQVDPPLLGAIDDLDDAMINLAGHLSGEHEHHEHHEHGHHGHEHHEHGHGHEHHDHDDPHDRPGRG